MRPQWRKNEWKIYEIKCTRIQPKYKELEKKKKNNWQKYSSAYWFAAPKIMMWVAYDFSLILLWFESKSKDEWTEEKKKMKWKRRKRIQTTTTSTNTLCETNEWVTSKFTLQFMIVSSQFSLFLRMIMLCCLRLFFIFFFRSHFDFFIISACGGGKDTITWQILVGWCGFCATSTKGWWHNAEQEKCQVYSLLSCKTTHKNGFVIEECVCVLLFFVISIHFIAISTEKRSKMKHESGAKWKKNWNELVPRWSSITLRHHYHYCDCGFLHSGGDFTI